MPELPDVTVYVEALAARILGRPLEQVRIGSPFVLRSVDPPITEAAGRRVSGVRRLGKRVVLALESDLFLVMHLMIAGRLRWRPRGAAVPRGRGLAALDFPAGTVLLTEEGKKHRAGLWLVRGEAGLAAHDRGGLEPLEISLADFGRALRGERHTLKRSLTDPALFSGIGNAYSDEILHAARLSPLQLTTNLDDDEIARLYEAMRATLVQWTGRLRAEAGDGFPEKVTAFREGMAVHGRYNQPCPVCCGRTGRGRSTSWMRSVRARAAPGLLRAERHLEAAARAVDAVAALPDRGPQKHLQQRLHRLADGALARRGGERARIPPDDETVTAVLNLRHSAQIVQQGARRRDPRCHIAGGRRQRLRQPPAHAPHGGRQLLGAEPGGEFADQLHEHRRVEPGEQRLDRGGETVEM